MLSLRRLAAITFSASLILALTGCGLGDAAPAGANTLSQTGTLTGTIYGGNTPIINATINLYQAGAGGYGKAVGATGGPKLLATTTSRDYDSEFSFTKDADGTTGSGISDGTTNVWACPTDSDPLIYILAVGGNPNGGSDHTVNNNAIVQAGAIAYCDQVTGSSRVNLSEISTAAFATSFGQFMYPGTSTPGAEGISANGVLAYGTTTGGSLASTAGTQGAFGLYNAFQIYSKNLLNIATGLANTSSSYTGTSASVTTITVTATPESAKLITEANILSACINSSNTSTTPNVYCSQLFDGSQKPYLASATAYGGTFPTAVDTLQAALYMAINPATLGSAGTNAVSSGGACSASGATTNMGCLFALVPRNVAFSGSLGSAPTDWTVGITYTAGASGATTNICSPNGGFITNVYKSAVDATGNLYFINDISLYRSVAEMSPWGLPLGCIKPSLAGNSRGLAFDIYGTLWSTFNYQAGSIYQLQAAGTTLKSWTDTNYNSSATPTNTGDAPFGLASDKTGTVLFTTQYNGGNLREFPAPGADKTATPSTVISSNVNGAATSNGLLDIAVDPSGNVWGSSTTSASYPLLKPSTAKVTYAIQTWTAAAPVSGSSTYTFNTSGTLPTVGATLLFSGFSAASTPLKASAAVNGISATVLTSASGKFTASFVTTYTSSVSTQTETTAVAATIPTYAVTTLTGNTAAYGAAIDSSGYFYNATDVGGSKNPVLQKWTNGTSPTLSSSAAYAGGINGARSVALDGADNVWVANALSETGNAAATSNFGVAEIATSGSGTSATFTPLSPAPTSTPSSCIATSTGCPTGGGFYKNDLSGPTTGISIDPSGNVWAPVNSSVNIVQFVGAAVPVVTPIVTGLVNGTLATKP